MKRNPRARLFVQSLETRTVPATFTVTNLNNNGAGSLRNAIQSANGLAGADTVDFQAGLTGFINLTGGDIGITETVTIIGPGANVISINGVGAGRIFTTKNTVGFAELAVIGVTLTGGFDAGGGAVMGDDERLIFQDCQITGNVSTGGGGAVYLTGNGTVQMFNTTVNGNSAALDGGGVCVNGTKAELYLYNSTLSGNTCGGDGGGVYIKVAANNALFIWNSTISSNNANRGGGIALDPASAAICSVDSSIVYNNTAPTGPDCFAPTLQLTYSALGSKSGLTVFSADPTTNALLGQDFKLGPLTNNGGSVMTRKPAIDSPVRDKAQNISGSTFDARGTGYPREINALVDCGAVECDPLFIVKNDNDSGPDSLRQQVIDANLFVDDNTITFDAAAFAATDDTITLSSQLVVTYALNIVGPGARSATISGNNVTRIIDNSGAPVSTTLSVSGLSLNNGAAGRGAAILMGLSQDLILTDCAFTNNKATSDYGGAIYLDSNTFTDLTIRGCTFAGNEATSRGGGIYMLAAGSVAIENSTFSGNVAKNAGAFSLNGGLLSMSVRNCTIAGNIATQATFATGGLYVASASTIPINIESCVIAQNTGQTQPDVFANAPTVVATNCAIGSAAGITNFAPDATTTALLGQDFKLGALANNGGPTDTILPAVITSPIVDAGSNSLMLVNDQRGIGFGRVRGGGIDIGAVEFPSPFVVTNTKSTGSGSLRQAVTDADSFTGPDVITFDAAVFSAPSTITLGSGIAIDEAVEIQGRGANVITINAAKNGRVFGTSNAAAGSKFVISGLRFINGVHADPGGAINIGDENVFIVACEFSDNTSTGSGGAITVNGGNLTVVDSTFANNTSSTGNGGGIHFTGAGNLIVRNSTFSGNKASTNNGGGVSLDNHTGSSSFMNCTINSNSSFTGGGIGRFAGSSTISIESCIVTGNSAASGPDIATSGILDAKTSLLGTVAATTFTKDAVTTNLLGKAANLGALADNGGPTRTHALQAGSPAIGQGSNPFNLQFDQRGTAYPRSAQLKVDCGAVEFSPPAQFTSYQVNDGTAQRSSVTSLTVAFDTIVAFVGSPAAAFKLERATPLPVASVSLAASVDNTFGYSRVTLTFTGGSVNGPSLADGRYNFTILANQFLGAGFDGDANGTAGDNITIIGAPANGLFRLFGDADGKGTMTAADFNAFRLAYGTSGPSIFDFDGDNQVSASDFNQFRTRYGVTI